MEKLYLTTSDAKYVCATLKRPAAPSASSSRTCELLLLEELDEAVLEPDRAQPHLPALLALWVVHDAHALLDAVVVADERLNHLLGLHGTQGGRPAQCVSN
jgi:hypothetical protein